MPALPVVPGVLKLTLNWGIDGDASAQTVQHQRFSGAPDATDLAIYAGDVVSASLDAFQSLCTTFTGVLSATIRDLASDMGVEVTGGSPWVGMRTGARLSPGTAFVMSGKILRHYRGGQPRTYLPLGAGADIATTGLWADAFVTDVETAWTAFRSNVEFDTYASFEARELCNVSYYGPPNRTITGSGGRVRTVSTLRAAPIVNNIVNYTGRKKIGSQRRRNKAA